MPLLELRNISHAYGDRPVVRGLSFTLERGRIACLLGPSGCGKTTVLRCIAGFEPLTGGEIRLKGSVVSTPRRQLPPERRSVGMVFQDYALFPHLTVAQNVAFGLRRMERAERERRVVELLETVGLAPARDSYPHELSGGQQQRVALARALAPRPDLLLLDEPFSNLDVGLRERLSHEVRAVLKRYQTTAVLVTHDQHEAFAMADEIGIMHEGTIQQWDSAFNLYHRPANRFVADFVGQGALLPGVVLNERSIEFELGIIAGEFTAGFERGSQVDVLLRPDDVVFDPTSAVRAEVTHKAFRGAETLYTLRLPGGGRLLALFASHHDLAPGERIGIRLDAEHLVAFPRSERAQACGTGETPGGAFQTEQA